MELLIEESIKITPMLDKNSQKITIIIDSILDEKMVNMGVILGTERNTIKDNETNIEGGINNLLGISEGGIIF